MRLEMKEDITHKICSSCNKRFLLEEFPFNPTTERRDSECWECIWNRAKPKSTPKIMGKGRPIMGFGTKPEQNIKEKSEIIEVEKLIEGKKPEVKHRKPVFKVCTRCKEEKPRKEFYYNGQLKSKLDNYCISCRKKIQEEIVMKEVDGVYEIVYDFLKDREDAIASEIKTVLPKAKHSRIYVLLNSLVDEGKLNRVRIKNINHYSLPETEKLKTVKVEEKEQVKHKLELNDVGKEIINKGIEQEKAYFDEMMKNATEEARQKARVKKVLGIQEVKATINITINSEMETYERNLNIDNCNLNQLIKEAERLIQKHKE